MAERWTHETTEDDLYVERAGVLDRLERWADDPEVRVIAVTGMGGQGKTSLIGHWLRKKWGATGRRTSGLFAWSFYISRDVDELLRALLEYGASLGIPVREEVNARPAALALAMLRTRPVVLVLDGIEVLQGLPRSATYGELLHDALRELLDGACRDAGGGLVVLTSRFPFADLRPYLGEGLRSLDLDRLSGDEGAVLLRRCGVGGTEDGRRDVSERFEGHPLALRVFAATLLTQAHGDPTRLCHVVFTDEHLSDGNDFEGKLKRLLTFYETSIPAERAMLLGIVAMFLSPLGARAIIQLARRLPKAREVFSERDDRELVQHLRGLVLEHLLVREPSEQGEDRYTCHPVLRDHFRVALLGKDPRMATEAAGMLTERPSREPPKSVEDITTVLVAIELLLDAGEFVQAHELYQDRLNRGHVFKQLPAPYAGLQCALGFVKYAVRGNRFEMLLSTRAVGYYLYEVAIHSMNCGEMIHADSYYAASEAADRKAHDHVNLSIVLANRAELLTSLGRLHEAEAAALEALTLAHERGNVDLMAVALARAGNVLALFGRGHEAVATFERGYTFKRSGFMQPDLYGIYCVWWAAQLLRLGQIARARQLTQANIGDCIEHERFDNVARCRWILGCADTAEGLFDAAIKHLTDAESTMRRSYMLKDLPAILVAIADLHRRRGAWDEARRYVDEALRIAAPREMRLDHADALVLRGRTVLDRELAAASPSHLNLERARDDGDAAIEFARDTGYAWAERDALFLIADASTALGDTSRAKATSNDAHHLARRLALPEETEEMLDDDDGP